MSNFMTIAWRQNISEDVNYILTTRKKDVHAFWKKKKDQKQAKDTEIQHSLQ